MQKREKNQKPLSIIINFIMIIIATISILPFILMFVMSTQDNQMIFSGVTFRLGNALHDNFRTILEADYFRSVLNSLIVAVSSTVLTVLFSAMAGFAFAKYNFKHKNLLFQIVLMTMMVPMEVGLVAFAFQNLSSSNPAQHSQCFWSILDDPIHERCLSLRVSRKRSD